MTTGILYVIGTLSTWIGYGFLVWLLRLIFTRQNQSRYSGYMCCWQPCCRIVALSKPANPFNTVGLDCHALPRLGSFWVRAVYGGKCGSRSTRFW